MTTPVRRRTLRARLLAFIRDATDRLTAAWRILARAQTKLLDALAAIRPGRNATTRIRTATADFQRAIADFNRSAGAFTERWAATDLPIAYQEGSLAMLDRADRPRRLWSWTARHQAAITGLSSQFYADLMGRITQTVRRAQAFLRSATDAARSRVSRFETARFDRAALRRDHPLDTVIYAKDSRHPVEAWAGAALAWQAVTTANTGGARTALEQLNCQWLEVRDGLGCGWENHEDTDTANGSLRTVQDALAHPSAHPHCQREFLPRPDIITRPDYAFGGTF